MTDLEPFLKAMHDRDLDALAAALAPDIEMRSPILAAPIRGREQVLGVLELIFGGVDELHYGEALGRDRGGALLLTARVGAHELEGVELFRQDDAGLVDQVTVMLRPLDGLVALQNVVAPAIGAPVLQLVPAV